MCEPIRQVISQENCGIDKIIMISDDICMIYCDLSKVYHGIS